MKTKKFPIHFNIFKITKYSYSFTIGFIVLFLIGFVYFLYSNVYQTLGYAKEVTGLKQKVTAVFLDVDKFDLIIKKIEAKTKAVPTDYTKVFNPFPKTQVNAIIPPK